MKKINIDNKIFKNKEFIKDEYKFSLISHNLQVENSLIYSDEETYVFVKGNKWNTIWIWTKDNIPIEKIPEIMELLTLYINENEDKVSFACKQELYELLSKFEYEYLPIQDYFVSGCYKCFNPIEPNKRCDGYLDKPKVSEREIIAKMWHDNCDESGYAMDSELALKFADRFIDSDTFYAWRNDENKIVSIIGYTVINDWAEVAHAYTIPSERGKGYMANSVYQVTKRILDKGLTPVLSTDYNYLPSNKAYTNVGYVEDDKLIKFTCSKEKLNRKGL